MSWKMMDFSKETGTCLQKHHCGDNPVAAAYVLLRDMLKPYVYDPFMTYRYEHSLRVARWGMQIAEGENWDVQPLLLACLLHDVGYPECKTEEDFANHQEVSAQIAEMFLNGIGYGKSDTKSVCRAIQIHNLWDDVPSDATSFELSVRDADDLDRFDMLRTYMKGNAIVGNAFVCDRSSEQVIAECEKQLRRIEEDSGHICATPTARRLWAEQLGERRAYFDKLVRQMRSTQDMEWRLQRMSRGE